MVFPFADLSLADASSESQADALASWMRGSEDALSAAHADGLQDVWRSSARAAVAAKGAAPANAMQQLPAGAMLDGKIWELTTVDVEAHFGDPEVNERAWLDGLQAGAPPACPCAVTTHREMVMGHHGATKRATVWHLQAPTGLRSRRAHPK